MLINKYNNNFVNLMLLAYNWPEIDEYNKDDFKLISVVEKSNFYNITTKALGKHCIVLYCI